MVEAVPHRLVLELLHLSLTSLLHPVLDRLDDHLLGLPHLLGGPVRFLNHMSALVTCHHTAVAP